MKAIMYHYVRGETSRPPSYYYLDIDDFRRQLDYFEAEFGFVSKDEFLSVVRGNWHGTELPSGVLLTFDDGLKDHYDVVYPELKKRGLWGMFYVPTAPYETGDLLDVHRIHTLLGEISGKELLKRTQQLVDEEMIPHERRMEYREETYTNQTDADATKQVKRILNFFVADSYQSEIIDELADQLAYEFPNPTEYYITGAEMREIHERGHVIGGHTCTHPVLSKLDKKDQRAQITRSFGKIEKLVGGLADRTFCYPYGRSYAFDGETLSILHDINCDWCFKVEASDIDQDDLRQRPQALPRYDCADFPYGEASGSIGPSMM